MTVYINRVGSAPDFDALPIAKLLDYPGEKRDFRPFAQAQFALGEKALFVRLMAFEVDPDPQSRLSVALEGGVLLSCFPGGRLEELGGGGLGAKAQEIGSEDLQGIYWGADLALPLAPLSNRLGRTPAVGMTLRGNVFKSLYGGKTGRDHFGCLFPCSPFDLGDEGQVRSFLAKPGFGELTIVGY